MEHLEKVEKLKEKANVSYEEAKAALEACDWDLLDAIVKLEADGKIKNKAASEFSTKGSVGSDDHKSPHEIAESYQNYQDEKNKKENGFFHSMWNGIKFLIKKGCENKFFVKRHDEPVLDMPVLLLVILMAAFFWVLIIIMIIGLFFGFKYSFTGPDLGREDINDAMEKASRAAEDLKTEMKEHEHHE